MRYVLDRTGCLDLCHFLEEWHQADLRDAFRREFEQDPFGISHSIFKFASQEPRRLSLLASELIDYLEESINPEELTEGAKLVKICFDLRTAVLTMSGKMDNFTKDFALLKPWYTIYKEKLEVTRVWRTKSDEMINDPEVRNMLLKDVPNRLCSIVTAEHNSGKQDIMMVVSDGVYLTQEDGPDVRADYLIDIPEMFMVGCPKAGTVARSGRGCGRDTTVDLMVRSVDLMEEMLKATNAVAKILAENNGLKDHERVYRKIQEYVKKLLNPEDSPNALIEIGGWS